MDLDELRRSLISLAQYNLADLDEASRQGEDTTEDEARHKLLLELLHVSAFNKAGLLYVQTIIEGNDADK